MAPHVDVHTSLTNSPAESALEDRKPDVGSFVGGAPANESRDALLPRQWGLRAHSSAEVDQQLHSTSLRFTTGSAAMLSS